MTTRGDMIAEMEDEMDRSDTTAFVNNINSAIRHYQSTRFWFNETRDTTFNTVIGTQDYTIGMGAAIDGFFYDIDGLFLTFGSAILDLKPVDYRNIELLRSTPAPTGVPIAFSYVAESLVLYPTPDAVYSARVAGHEKIAAPADNSEADNVWMNEGYDLIKARAKAHLFAFKYRDVEGAAIERTAEADFLSDLLATTASKTGTGMIRPTQF